MSASRILVVDDEPQVHRFLKPALETEGYTVDRADTAMEGLRAAAVRAPAAVLLDLGLPDLDGQDALPRFRAITQSPILVVSARDQDTEKVRALDAGADDYIEKPFTIPELLARLRACLRRVLVQEGVAQPWRGGGIEVDLLRHRVLAGGQEVPLTRREYDLLVLLVRNAGRIVTHQLLLRTLWGPQHVEDVQYLRVYVGHLRQKLGPGAAGLIKTELGIGYRLAETEP